MVRFWRGRSRCRLGFLRKISLFLLRGLDLQALGHFSHAHVHALQGVDGHQLHLKGLNGGQDRFGVLFKPEMNRLQLLNAFLYFFGIHGWRNPMVRLRQGRIADRELL